MGRRIAAALCLLCFLCIPAYGMQQSVWRGELIRWVDFTPTSSVMRQAMEYDVGTYGTACHSDWLQLLAALAASTGGRFPNGYSSALEKLHNRVQAGEWMEDITADTPYYAYYLEAYTAVLDGFLGETAEVDPETGNTRMAYGLQVYSPIAAGYGFSHYEDFGNARSYGFARRHLGNDLMGAVGTPVIAVESGTVEAAGWNRYGGWRIGIRSDDRKRYYYYAHLRKNHPYVPGIEEGARVEAGDVIGYLGMTGYSVRENVNNINTPHLHFGLQLIFDESQKDGASEIWIDVYELVELLRDHPSRVVRNEGETDYHRP